MIYKKGLVRNFTLLLVQTILVLYLIVNISLAASKHQIPKAKSKPSQEKIVQVEASLVVDGNTGRILHAKNADRKIYSASLTKLMTLYLLFEKLDSGKWDLKKQLKVSKYASDAEPSKLYLKSGSTISVETAINALIVKSANDVARVVGENISNSEVQFAKLMTVRAKQLGMKNTKFANASGLHHPDSHSTAIDLAKLSIAIRRDFSQYYKYFKNTSFKYNGKTITGHNRLTKEYAGADGLKTGFTSKAGKNLITSAKRDGVHLIGVVIGSPSAAVRDNKMIALLDHHFALHNKVDDKKSTLLASNKSSKKLPLQNLPAQNSKKVGKKIRKAGGKKKGGSKITA